MSTDSRKGRKVTAMNDWQPITETAPAEGEVVMTRIDDGRGPRNEQHLKRQGRLWFTSDGKMYVYYVPTHYIPLPGVWKPEDATQ